MGITYGIVAEQAKDKRVDDAIFNITDEDLDEQLQIIVTGKKGEAYYVANSNDTREIIIFESENMGKEDKLVLINNNAKYKDIRIIYIEDN